MHVLQSVAMLAENEANRARGDNKPELIDGDLSSAFLCLFRDPAR